MSFFDFSLFLVNTAKKLLYFSWLCFTFRATTAVNYDTEAKKSEVYTINIVGAFSSPLLLLGSVVFSLFAGLIGIASALIAGFVDGYRIEKAKVVYLKEHPKKKPRGAKDIIRLLSSNEIGKALNQNEGDEPEQLVAEVKPDQKPKDDGDDFDDKPVHTPRYS